MENVQTELPSEPWKARLVPPDISDRRPIFLGDNKSLHLGRGKRKQIQVLLEDKQGEIVFARVRQKGFGEGEDILADAGFASLDDRSGKSDSHKPVRRKPNEGS
jgi:hypothetical protein